MQFQIDKHLRQTQSQKLSQQAIQSIRILQMNGQDLHAFLTDEAEKNPLLDLSFPVPGKAAQASPARPVPSPSAGIPAGGDLPGIAETHACPVTLREYLLDQATLTFRRPQNRRIAAEIIESIEPDGYLRRPISDIARALGLPERPLLDVLARIQQFDPCGVAARDLAECLRLQLQDRGELTDKRACLLANLPLLAAYDFDALARKCGCDRNDVMAMVARLKQLNPAPGRQFDNAPVPLAMPDILLTPAREGEFRVELNPEVLPRALVDREYQALIRPQARETHEKKFIADCLRNATWLVRNLDMRAQTILRVATELVAQQREFFLHGAASLRPLCLRDIADAVGVHQSTVSRAIANKYILGPRGLVAMKSLFSEGLATSGGEEQVSGAAVRNRISALVNAERADAILSDDAIVSALDRSGITIARRTVAKYRRMLRIPSSSVRRRMKAAQAQPAA